MTEKIIQANFSQVAGGSSPSLKSEIPYLKKSNNVSFENVEVMKPHSDYYHHCHLFHSSQIRFHLFYNGFVNQNYCVPMYPLQLHMKKMCMCHFPQVE